MYCYRRAFRNRKHHANRAVSLTIQSLSRHRENLLSFVEFSYGFVINKGENITAGRIVDEIRKFKNETTIDRWKLSCLQSEVTPLLYFSNLCSPFE